MPHEKVQMDIDGGIDSGIVAGDRGGSGEVAGSSGID